VILAAISKMSRPTEEALLKAPIPQLVVARLGK